MQFKIGLLEKFLEGRGSLSKDLLKRKLYRYVGQTSQEQQMLKPQKFQEQQKEQWTNKKNVLMLEVGQSQVREVMKLREVHKL